MGFGFRDVTPWEYLRTQPEVILHYLKLCFWPSAQCIDYGWPVQNDPRMIYGLGAIIMLALAGAMALLWFRPRLGFIACMFFAVLSPTSSFIPIRDLAFEHRMYLALACVVLGVVLGADALLQRFVADENRRRVAFAGLLATIVMALSLRTFDRNRIYHDPIELWKEVAVRSPWHSRGAYNVGHLLLQRGRVPADQYQHLLLHDAWELERVSKREVHAPVTGDFAEAITWFKKVLEIDPQDASAAFNIAGVYDLGGESQAAIDWYEKALAINKQHLNARMNLARLLADRGDVEAAERQFEIAVAQAPREGRVYLSFGCMLANAGRHAQALAQYQRAREHHAAAASVDYRVALSKWELGEERAAIEALRKLRRAHRPRSEVSASLAKFLALTTDPQLYQPAEGAAIAMELMRQSPSAEAFEALAYCQAELKQYEAAAQSIERGLELAEKQHDRRRIALLRSLRSELPSPVSASSS
jgi:tetratricopeptide (TPR) repeat protein